MKVLISVVSLEEASIAIEGGADILDIKNPGEGSLGAQFAPTLLEIAALAKHYKTKCSAAIGDLGDKAGTASLAAYGAATMGMDYVKAGIVSPDQDNALHLASQIVKAVKSADKQIQAVIAGYADFRKTKNLSYHVILEVAHRAKADVVMLDTLIKDGTNLFDNLSLDEVREFVEKGHDLGMQVALAGSLNVTHLEMLTETGVDVIGIRGAVCSNNDRSSFLDKEKLVEFLAEANKCMNLM
ncbi:MAG: hypothetical protein HKN22_07170 [Bacteroidia bacterium]|nr:hypothetical protein [Bacteroidia bacterium]